MFGRFSAESLLSQAGELEPGNPEPFYYLGHVGVALRGDDGEAIARRGLQRVLEIEPRYRDAWQMWERLYRGEAERRAAAAALAWHSGAPAPDLWRAQLLIELEEYPQAESLLLALAARQPMDPAPRALLSQARFEDGRDDAGAGAYDEALARAGTDTGEVLWRQVRSIATPGERAEWARTAPAERATFLRRFWAYRDPRVATAVNERLGEHFRRLREARQSFALLHPNSLYHHSRVWRTLVGGPGPLRGPGIAELASAVRSEAPPRVADSLVALGVGLPGDDAADETPNLDDGLDDRGRVFVRYGLPDERRVWSLDGETWRYHLPSGILQVTFVRRTNGWGVGGDVVITPFVAGEPAAARYLLATDRTAEPASLAFAFWPAAFRGATRWLTDLVLFPDPASVTAVLIDGDGRAAARDDGSAGPLHLTAAPGEYVLALDAERDDRHGRFRGSVALPPFTGERLSVSGVLVAAAPAAPTRAAMEAAAPTRLQLRADAPLRLYAEVYGLAPAEGARYEASYTFERLDRARLPRFLGGGARRTVITFRREPPPGRLIVESVILDPGRLAAGRYRARLEIRDLATDARAASPSLDLELR